MYCENTGDQGRGMEGLRGLNDMIERILSKESLSQLMDGYETREGQLIMAREVARVMEEGGMSLIEGGTGVGKTLAYLIPAALFAITEDTRVAISTSTKSLQDQVIFKDLPLVQKLLKSQGIALKASHIKGRGNYLCLHRLSNALQRGQISAETMGWAQSSPYGDLEHAPQTGLSYIIGSRWEYCLGKNCPHREACFYQKAWKKAEESHLMVVNHHLLLSHHLTEKKGLPLFERLIIDEAHRLEKTALDVLGESVSISYLLRRVQGLLGLEVSLMEAPHFMDGLRSLERLLHRVLASLASIIPSGRTSKEALELAEEAIDLLRGLSVSLEGVALMGEGMVRRLGEEAPMMGEVAMVSKEFLTAARILSQWIEETSEGVVKWIELEVSDVPSLSFHSTPLDVSGPLKEYLFSATDGVVLTSATLSVGGSMEYVRKTLGIEKAREVFLPPEFAYEQQVRLVVMKSMPQPRSKDYKEGILDGISSILQERGGQTLILFTAYHLMEEIARTLRDRFPTLHFYIQGERGRDILVNLFRGDRQGVLVGVESFWEGIDLPGEALKTLIIVKLPFRSPEDPLVAARSRWLQEQGKDPFEEYLLPEAVLTFRQGFGRLIRSKEDTGVVYILDPRILKRGYGRVFLSSIPKINVETE